MQFTWQHPKEAQPISLKLFLKQKQISKNLLARLKFHGGEIFINQVPKTVRATVKPLDYVSIILPPEPVQDFFTADPTPLDIIYEDEHLLVINKPANIPSLPSKAHPNQTVANRLRYYYEQQQYPQKTIHIVTRLDKDTSGAMLIAKHQFAHGQLDQLLQQKKIQKFYYAWVPNIEHTPMKQHDHIIKPIKRVPYSLIKREVHPEGKYAHTEYWLEEQKESFSKLKIQLHTGRTHQIRVHFASLGTPLLGDQVYEGHQQFIQRQALHCHTLSFPHPFTDEILTLHATLPDDLKQLNTL